MLGAKPIPQSNSKTEDQRGAGVVHRRLRAFGDAFDPRLDTYLSEASGGAQPVLAEAVRYALLAPGKRIRPYLTVRCCELVGGDRALVWPFAAAVECVHAFSLIHDDLPAMDDDDVRRGQPTCHKKFGEAVAILAGDALVVLAFDLLGRHVADRRVAADAVVELARAIGWTGMIGGQAADVLGEGRPPQRRLAEYIHERKTAALFAGACRLGAMAGTAPDESVARLGRFGQRLGRAFQIADDLLDVTASREAMGKPVDKDTTAGKQTFPACVGREESRVAARDEVEAAVAELAALGPEADDLRLLARFVVDRNN